LYRVAPNESVVLVGGCAMNSVANGKVTRETPFQNVFIPAGAADNGTSFGAAFHVWHCVMQQPRTFLLDHAFWGNGVDPAECRAAAVRGALAAREMSKDLLLDHCVEAICDGKVVGWFHDRMEFGARALGN